MWSGKIEDYILYEDKNIIVCHKPAQYGSAECTDRISRHGKCIEKFCIRKNLAKCLI